VKDYYICEHCKNDIKKSICLKGHKVVITKKNEKGEKIFI